MLSTYHNNNDTNNNMHTYSFCAIRMCMCMFTCVRKVARVAHCSAYDFSPNAAVGAVEKFPRMVVPRTTRSGNELPMSNANSGGNASSPEMRVAARGSG